jgi:DNA-binding NarL/FixJ family response regulator
MKYIPTERDLRIFNFLQKGFSLNSIDQVENLPRNTTPLYFKELCRKLNIKLINPNLTKPNVLDLLKKILNLVDIEMENNRENKLPVRLTKTQMERLEFFKQGLSGSEIATKQGVSRQAVSQTKCVLLNKIGVEFT